jgi:hypothetical protein
LSLSIFKRLSRTYHPLNPINFVDDQSAVQA